MMRAVTIACLEASKYLMRDDGWEGSIIKSLECDGK